MKLSILIPTVIERAEQFHKLKQFIFRQIIDYELTDEVELIFWQDNKEMTIGEKRNKLYAMATGEYAMQVDDDDWLHYKAIPLIYDRIKTESRDCVTFKELCIFDGKTVKSSNISLKYADWADNEDGYDYVRTPFFKTAIRTDFCKITKIPPIRFGEDHAFAKAIKPLLFSESHIDEFIYHYQHNSSDHNERYGIK